jgi:hypothetical protein
MVKSIFPNISYQQKTTYYQNNFINNVADFELDYFPHITAFIGRYLIYIRKMHLTMTRLLRKGKLIPIVLKSYTLLYIGMLSVDMLTL